MQRSESDIRSAELQRREWMRFTPAARATLIRHIVKSEAERDISDPFTAARTQTHLLNNMTTPHDYGLSHEAIERIAPNPFGLLRKRAA